jgi:hypothetical protein
MNFFIQAAILHVRKPESYFIVSFDTFSIVLQEISAYYYTGRDIHMNPYHCQNYSKAQIEKLLKQFKECIRDNKFSISMNENRLDNEDFIRKYNLTRPILTALLLSIKTDDFCHSLKNTNSRFGSEDLFVFIPVFALINNENSGKLRLENVDVYVKFKICCLKNCQTRAVVISFHKRKKPADYLFKKKKTGDDQI